MLQRNRVWVGVLVVTLVIPRGIVHLRHGIGELITIGIASTSGDQYKVMDFQEHFLGHGNQANTTPWQAAIVSARVNRARVDNNTSQLHKGRFTHPAMTAYMHHHILHHADCPRARARRTQTETPATRSPPFRKNALGTCKRLILALQVPKLLRGIRCCVS